jgi:hypothetical protein
MLNRSTLVALFITFCSYTQLQIALAQALDLQLLVGAVRRCPFTNLISNNK